MLLLPAQALHARQQREKAHQWHQHQLLLSVVHAWEAHTLFKLERQRLHRKAVRHRWALRLTNISLLVGLQDHNCINDVL